MHRFKKFILAAVLALAPVIGAGVAGAASSTFPYTVKGNDTMWKISLRYGISLDSLIRANPQVANPNIIWPGMVLNIPRAGWQQGTDTSTSTYADQVVQLVNQERAKAGLKPLVSDRALAAMALDKAKDMYHNRYFSHYSPTYGSPFDMMRSYGIQYRYAGENIAMGQRTPQEVMNAWMKSPGHRQNILNPNFTKIGVAYYKGEWVQEFIG